MTAPHFEDADSAPEAGNEVQRIVSSPQYTLRHSALSACEFELHSHPAFVVTALLAGRMSVTIGSEDFDVEAGQVTLTNVNQTHAGRSDSVEFISIFINPLLVSELISETGLARTAPDIVFRATVVSDEALHQTARAIAAEMTGERVGHQSMLDALMRQLVIHLLRSHLTVRQSAQIELSRAGPVDRRLRRAIEFMHTNFERDLALEEIASAAYLSEYHFARLFKRIMGVTPHGYLANLRIERARKLLAETALPVSEIALTVGYQSQSHFTKVFKSVTGITPRAYRESAKG